MVEDRVLQEMIAEEFHTANLKYPMFHSPHEAYAVIKEELEELESNVKEYRRLLETIWLGAIKRDWYVTYIDDLRMLEKIATETIKEAVQCAAMARKAIASNEEETEYARLPEDEEESIFVTEDSL